MLYHNKTTTATISFTTRLFIVAIFALYLAPLSGMAKDSAKVPLLSDYDEDMIAEPQQRGVPVYSAGTGLSAVAASLQDTDEKDEDDGGVVEEKSSNSTMTKGNCSYTVAIHVTAEELNNITEMCSGAAAAYTAEQLYNICKRGVIVGSAVVDEIEAPVVTFTFQDAEIIEQMKNTLTANTLTATEGGLTPDALQALILSSQTQANALLHNRPTTRIIITGEQPDPLLSSPFPKCFLHIMCGSCIVCTVLLVFIIVDTIDLMIHHGNHTNNSSGW